MMEGGRGEVDGVGRGVEEVAVKMCNFGKCAWMRSFVSWE